MVQQRRALGAVEDALQHPFYGPAMPASPETNPRVGAAFVGGFSRAQRTDRP
jgi:hypothetical protein